MKRCNLVLLYHRGCNAWKSSLDNLQFADFNAQNLSGRGAKIIFATNASKKVRKSILRQKREKVRKSFSRYLYSKTFFATNMHQKWLICLFPDRQESFQTVRKFPDCPESLQSVQKVSRLYGKSPDRPETF